MTIKELLKMPIGSPIGGGFLLSIKTYKKTWQSNGLWFGQVILMDESGEIPADVKLGDKYSPLRGRAQAIKIIVAELQAAEYLGKDRKKLYVEQWMVDDSRPPIAEPDMTPFEMYQAGVEPPQIIRGKIKCWAMGSLIQRGDTLEQVLEELENPNMDKIIDSVMRG